MTHFNWLKNTRVPELEAWLTDEVGLARVDGVLQLIGGDAELILWRPVDSDGVVGGGAQLLSYRRRVGGCARRKQEHRIESEFTYRA